MLRFAIPIVVGGLVMLVPNGSTLDLPIEIGIAIVFIVVIVDLISDFFQRISNTLNSAGEVHHYHHKMPSDPLADVVIEGTARRGTPRDEVLPYLIDQHHRKES
jgi:hypothetical protein